jgi:hypothetical protein
MALSNPDLKSLSSRVSSPTIAEVATSFHRLTDAATSSRVDCAFGFDNSNLPEHLQGASEMSRGGFWVTRFHPPHAEGRRAHSLRKIFLSQVPCVDAQAKSPKSA